MSSQQSDTKPKILAASLDLLEKNRGKNVRLEDVAKRAGVSRQAVYLHFQSRIGLMVATVQYADQVRHADKQVQPWRDAVGKEKLEAWLAFWCHYIPQIYGVAKALLIMRDGDEAAAAAWNDRMTDIRKSCRKTIEELSKSGQLSAQWTVPIASDLLWSMLSIERWEQLTIDCGWSQKKYYKHVRALALKSFVRSDEVAD